MPRWYMTTLYYLWIAPHILLAAVSVMMFVRREHRNYPVFFVYTLYETFVFLFLFLNRTAVTVFTPNKMYWYFFAATLAGSAVLRFGVIQEIFNTIFSDYPRLERVATLSMRAITALLVVAAIVVAVHSTGNLADSLLAGVGLLNRSVAIIQAGSLLFLLAFSRMFGLSWRRFVFGIALGFGVLASTELVVWTERVTHLGRHLFYLQNLLPTGSYHVSVVIWLGCLLTAQETVGAAAQPVPEIDQWSGELERSR